SSMPIRCFLRICAISGLAPESSAIPGIATIPGMVAESFRKVRREKECDLGFFTGVEDANSCGVLQLRSGYFCGGKRILPSLGSFGRQACLRLPATARQARTPRTQP